MKETIKMSAEKRKKEKLMELNQEKKVANHLDLIAKISVFFQPTAGIIAILIMILQPAGYQTLGKGFSMSALIVSCVITRIYIQTSKKLEALKTLSPEDENLRRKEYFYKFLSVYPMWLLFYFLFSVL